MYWSLIFDLDDETLSELIIFSKKVANAIKKAVVCERVGMSVIGLEVPHVHVHLIPINNMDDMSFDTKISMTESQFNETMNKIKSYI